LKKSKRRRKERGRKGEREGERGEKTKEKLGNTARKECVGVLRKRGLRCNLCNFQRL
jgi:hypothetical protein